MGNDYQERETQARDQAEGKMTDAERQGRAGYPEGQGFAGTPRRGPDGQPLDPNLRYATDVNPLPGVAVTAWKMHKNEMAFFIGVKRLEHPGTANTATTVNWRIRVKNGVAEAVDDSDSDSALALDVMPIQEARVFGNVATGTPQPKL